MDERQVFAAGHLQSGLEKFWTKSEVEQDPLHLSCNKHLSLSLSLSLSQGGFSLLSCIFKK